MFVSAEVSDAALNELNKLHSQTVTKGIPCNISEDEHNAVLVCPSSQTNNSKAYLS